MSEITKKINKIKQTKDPDLKSMMIFELMNFNPEEFSKEDLAEIVALLKEKEGIVREATSELIKYIANEEVVDLLAKLIPDLDLSLRNTAAEILAQIGRVNLNAIRWLINNEDEGVRKFGMEIAMRLNAVELLEDIIDKLKNDSDPNNKHTAAEVLAFLKPDEETAKLIYEQFDEWDIWGQFIIIEILAKLGSKYLIDILKKNIEDDLFILILQKIPEELADKELIDFLYSQIKEHVDIKKISAIVATISRLGFVINYIPNIPGWAVSLALRNKEFFEDTLKYIRLKKDDKFLPILLEAALTFKSSQLVDTILELGADCKSITSISGWEKSKILVKVAAKLGCWEKICENIEEIFKAALKSNGEYDSRVLSIVENIPSKILNSKFLELFLDKANLEQKLLFYSRLNLTQADNDVVELLIDELMKEEITVFKEILNVLDRSMILHLFEKFDDLSIAHKKLLLKSAVELPTTKKVKLFEKYQNDDELGVYLLSMLGDCCQKLKKEKVLYYLEKELDEEKMLDLMKVIRNDINLFSKSEKVCNSLYRILTSNVSMELYSQALYNYYYCCKDKFRDYCEELVNNEETEKLYRLIEFLRENAIVDEEILRLMVNFYHRLTISGEDEELLYILENYIEQSGGVA